MRLPFLAGHRLFKVLQWGDYGAANIEENSDLSQADIVASEVRAVDGLTGKHMVMFDVDIPMTVVPSSTSGHNHVYFHTYVSREAFFRLLDELANCGVVEPGYCSASKARGFAALRLPWVKKPGVE